MRPREGTIFLGVCMFVLVYYSHLSPLIPTRVWELPSLRLSSHPPISLTLHAVWCRDTGLIFQLTLARPATRMPGRSSLSHLCHSVRASVPGDLGAVMSLSSREASPQVSDLRLGDSEKSVGRSGVWSCCPLGVQGRLHEAPQNLAVGL